MNCASFFLALITFAFTLATFSPPAWAEIVMDFSNNTGLGYGVGTNQTITQNRIRMQAIAGKYEITFANELNLKDFGVGTRTVQFDLSDGQAFDFIGFDRQDAFGTATITSNNGGNITFDLFTPVDFSGPEWKNLSWIQVSASQQYGEFKFNSFTFQDKALPLSKCSASKLKVSSKKAADKAKCYVKALTKGTTIDPTCLSKAEEKYSSSFAKAEAKGGCLTTGDAATIEGKVDAFIADLVSELVP